MDILHVRHPYLSTLGENEGQGSFIVPRWAAGLFFYQSFDAIDGLVLFVTLAHEGALTQLARAAESRHEGRAWLDLSGRCLITGVTRLTLRCVSVA